MEAYLQKALHLKKLVYLGSCGGGCISDAKAYDTDIGKLFVKQNSDKEAGIMMAGEFESLTAIWKTGTLRVPRPHQVLPRPFDQGSVLVVQYLDLKSLHRYQSQLGEQLARLHLHNNSLKTAADSEQSLERESKQAVERESDSYVGRFGFPVPTCCGRIAQDNTWNKDWIDFYTNQRLRPQVEMIVTREPDRDLASAWSKLVPLIPKFFEGAELTPALLHGDLWSGNAAETDAGSVAFDPASFYGHSEYDLGIAGMFGGFSQAFHSSYHRLIPKAPGFDRRHQLYLLFHHLNHWNHFGSGYRSGSMSILKKLIGA